jgi:hypothetical protein
MTMLISKATLSTKARKLGLATTITVLWMATTPAAAQTGYPIGAARAAALQACSYFADDDWGYAYRACMAQHGQEE